MGPGASEFPGRHLCGSSLVYGSLNGFGDEIIEDLVYCHALQSELVVRETEICGRHWNATDLGSMELQEANISIQTEAAR